MGVLTMSKEEMPNKGDVAKLHALLSEADAPRPHGLDHSKAALDEEGVLAAMLAACRLSSCS